MVFVGETTRLFPVPTSVPPHEEVYHFIVAPWPPPPVKVKVALPEPHIVVTLAVADVGATEAGETVIVTVFEVAGESIAQVAVEVITTDTSSLFANVVDV